MDIKGSHKNGYLFMIKFHHNGNKFIFDNEIELLFILNNYNKYGVDKIKVFDFIKEKFVRIAITKFTNIINNDELIENHYKKNCFWKWR